LQVNLSTYLRHHSSQDVVVEEDTSLRSINYCYPHDLKQSQIYGMTCARNLQKYLPPNGMQMCFALGNSASTVAKQGFMILKMLSKG